MSLPRFTTHTVIPAKPVPAKAGSGNPIPAVRGKFECAAIRNLPPLQRSDGQPAVWIPAPRLRGDRLRGNDEFLGVDRVGALFLVAPALHHTHRHSRENVILMRPRFTFALYVFPPHLSSFPRSLSPRRRGAGIQFPRQREDRMRRNPQSPSASTFTRPTGRLDSRLRGNDEKGGVGRFETMFLVGSALYHTNTIKQKTRRQPKPSSGRIFIPQECG